MNLKELATKNRSHYQFQESEPFTPEQFERLVELARLSASAANLQPLKFMFSHDPGRNGAILSCLRGESFIQGFPAPPQGRQPAAYVIILGDTSITNNFWCNHGIAAQSILLGAVEMGFGGCILTDLDRQALARSLKIPGHLEILLVIALGVPRERFVITDAVNGETRCWQDINKVRHVPKRSLNDIILDL